MKPVSNSMSNNILVDSLKSNLRKVNFGLMKWTLIIFLLIGLSASLNGQRNNPFEIKDRLEDNYKNPAKTSHIHNELFVQEKVSVKQGKDTIHDENSRQEQEINENQVVGNPFEVDHVPIRRSQLKEKSAIKNRPAYPSITHQENIKSKENNLIAFLVSILSLILIAIVANTRRSLFNKAFKSFTNDNFLKLTQREENGGLNGAFIILYILFTLSLATFLYLIVRHFTGQTTSWWYLLLVIICIYFFRHFFLYLFSQIFPVEREAKQYNFTIAIYNLIIGILLIPFNLVIAYATDYLSIAAIYIALVIIGTVYLTRYIKGFLIGMIGSSRSIFHFLLYLCTFEIVPILVIIKLLQG